MNKIVKTLLITGPLVTGVFLWSSLDVAHAANVNCNSPNASVQDAVDNADGPTTIKINGTCFEDVTITKDDITLSGRPGMSACDKDDPGGMASAYPCCPTISAGRDWRRAGSRNCSVAATSCATMCMFSTRRGATSPPKSKPSWRSWRSIFPSSCRVPRIIPRTVIIFCPCAYLSCAADHYTGPTQSML